MSVYVCGVQQGGQVVLPAIGAAACVLHWATPPPAPQAQYRVFSMMGGMGLISVPSSCSMRYLQAVHQEFGRVKLCSQVKGASKVFHPRVTILT